MKDTMNKVHRIFYTDPAHGWLRVPVQDIHALELHDKITSCSYINPKYVYLEEDLDMSTYLDKCKRLGIKVSIKEKYCNGYSSIRNKDQYCHRHFMNIIRWQQMNSGK
jgi:hypothetical protein